MEILLSVNEQSASHAFSSMTPQLPLASARYELRNPMSHLPTIKVLEKCTKNLIGHSILAFNNHESNIDC